MRRLLVVGLVAAATGLAVVPAAGADIIQWRWDGMELKPGQTDASSSYPELRRVNANADCWCHYIQVAAHYSGSWTMYGNWSQALGSACHSYTGTMTLGGLVNNPLSVTQTTVPAWLRYPSWEQTC